MPQKLKDNLVIATRFDSRYLNIANKSVVEAYFKHLKGFSPKEIICVVPSDETYLHEVQQFSDNIIVSDKFTYGDFILKFYELGNANNLLIISFGVELEAWQLEHGFDLLRSRNLLSVGWRILQQENDGSYLGKLSYNTCMLHEPGFYDKVVASGGIPDYVENGAFGSVNLNFPEGTKELRIGGQEDLAVQLRIFKHLYGKKHRLFGHITHYGLNYLTQNQSTDQFNEKLLRKVITAEIYRKIENVNPKDFLDSWVVI